MNRRVDEWEWIQFQWPYLMALMGGKALISKLAYATGAFSRRRAVRSPADMLQLLLTWAVGERSLRETALLAAASEMADVSDVALLRRFERAGEWLGALLGNVLASERKPLGLHARVRLLDSTSITARGGRGTERRIHMTLDLATQRITSIELRDWRAAETLERNNWEAGEIVVADRGYAHRAGLAHVAAQGAYFVVRLPWSNVPLEDRAGNRFDLLAALRTLPEAEAGAFEVQFRNGQDQPIACRLVAIRKSEPQAQKTRQKALADGRRQGAKAVDVRTLETASYLFVLTNAPEELSAAAILDLYRFRWQIEMKFKVLKSVIHLDNIPTRNGKLLDVYLLAKLLVALVIDDLLFNGESFSPWGYPIQTTQLVERNPAPA
jgi:hypothetical protein